MKQILQHHQDQKYWISFDIDGVCAHEFKSTGTHEYNGLTLDFCYKLFEEWVPRSMGMDLSEVNFQLTEGAEREKDQQTFREMLEFLTHQVNRPVHDDVFATGSLYSQDQKIH